jgi:hypothetical protein
MFRKGLFHLLLVTLLFSCNEEDPLPRGSQLMLNPNLSQYPDSVFPWKPLISNRVEHGVSREVFVTGNRSLYLENQDSLIVSSASWTQTYTGPMPAPGSTLELVAFVKGENIRDLTAGGRIFIAFKVFPMNETESIASAVFDFQGDIDWVLLKATLEDFPKDAESIQVTLTMPDLTLGKVYFDEISLTVK